MRWTRCYFPAGATLAAAVALAGPLIQPPVQAAVQSGRPALPPYVVEWSPAG